MSRTIHIGPAALWTWFGCFAAACMLLGAGAAWLTRAEHRAEEVHAAMVARVEDKLPRVAPLGDCRQLVPVRAHGAVLLACLFDLPAPAHAGDFVHAEVRPGHNGIRTRLYGAGVQPPGSEGAGRRAFVWFFVENTTGAPATTLVSASAVLYRNTQTKTPAVAAAGVDVDGPKP